MEQKEHDSLKMYLIEMYWVKTARDINSQPLIDPFWFCYSNK